MGTSSHNRYHHCVTPTPSEVTITRRHHPLKGHTFEVLQTGSRQLVVRAPGGVAMRLPRAWTDADGAPADDGGAGTVFSVEAIRALVETLEALRRRQAVDVIASNGAFQGPEGGTLCPSKPVSSCGEKDSRGFGDGCRRTPVEP